MHVTVYNNFDKCIEYELNYHTICQWKQYPQLVQNGQSIYNHYPRKGTECGVYSNDVYHPCNRSDDFIGPLLRCQCYVSFHIMLLVGRNRIIGVVIKWKYGNRADITFKAPNDFTSHGEWWYYSDVMMGAMASQITSLTLVYSIVYSGRDERKHQSTASLVFVRGIHRWPVNSPHKGQVTRKMFPFYDVIMTIGSVDWSPNGSVMTCAVKCGLKLLIHSQILMVAAVLLCVQLFKAKHSLDQVVISDSCQYRCRLLL